MNILFLSAHVPSPAGRLAGQKTSYHICKWFSRRHLIHMLSFATDEELRHCRLEDNQICESWETIRVNRWSRMRGIARDWRKPLAVAARSAEPFRKALRARTDAHQFDVAILDHSAMWQYWPELRSIPVRVGSAHDVLSQLWQRKMQRPDNILLRAFFKTEHRRIQNWERVVLSKLDIVAPHSEKDAALLRGIDPSAYVCPIRAWFTASPSTSSVPREPGSIVFLGAFDRSENRDAVKYAIREILPFVRREYPGFKFYIAGSSSERVRQLTEGFNDIVLAGFVDDLPRFLSRMQIALLPLRLGAGIKVKVLESMGAGLGVVTTAAGAEGTGGQNEIHYLLAERSRELASHTVRLLQDPGFAKALGERARELVLQEFDFENALENLWSVVEARLSPLVHSAQV